MTEPSKQRAITLFRRAFQSGSPNVEETFQRLAALRELRNRLNQEERLWVQVAHEQGATWSEIGAELGTTKQAAQKRFGKVEYADEIARHRHWY